MDVEQSQWDGERGIKGKLDRAALPEKGSAALPAITREKSFEETSVRNPADRSLVEKIAYLYSHLNSDKFLPFPHIILDHIAESFLIHIRILFLVTVTTKGRLRAIFFRPADCERCALNGLKLSLDLSWKRVHGGTLIRSMNIGTLFSVLLCGSVLFEFICQPPRLRLAGEWWADFAAHMSRLPTRRRHIDLFSARSLIHGMCLNYHVHACIKILFH
jgi:hypothetical protein